ncbi:hypothetical protein D5F01_LYC03567 [Larimichthys crocea]|uniref:Uncharacterized protein n=1 Tax=Larimichthys crocea TaxID=215358 RepID=A0A6G0IZK7_LARCR|nr:hypothetical protein D5F01_LYC03567 [Larimichthys crocea]
MAVRLQGEWRLLRLKLLKAKSEITEYLISRSKNHQERLVCIPSGPEEEWRWKRRKKEKLDGGKPVMHLARLFGETLPRGLRWCHRPTPRGNGFAGRRGQGLTGDPEGTVAAAQGAMATRHSLQRPWSNYRRQQASPPDTYTTNFPLATCLRRRQL